MCGCSIRPSPCAGLRCAHEKLEIRKFQCANGVIWIVEQCQRCGRKENVLKKSSFTAIEQSQIQPFDYALRDAWRQRVAAYYAEQRDQKEHAWREWWGWYHDYLESAEWRAKRQLVLERDHHLCQSCFEAGHCSRATQVHHLTYERVGNEDMGHLQAICDECHKEAHPLHHDRPLLLKIADASRRA